MYRILLLCSAGMSTSLLVNRMNEAVKTLGEDAIITAMPAGEGINHLHDADCILLGPQVRYLKSRITKQVKNAGLKLPVEIMDMRDYGLMDGKKIYLFAKKLIEEK